MRLTREQQETCEDWLPVAERAARGQRRRVPGWITSDEILSAAHLALVELCGERLPDWADFKARLLVRIRSRVADLVRSYTNRKAIKQSPDVDWLVDRGVFDAAPRWAYTDAELEALRVKRKVVAQ